MTISLEQFFISPGHNFFRHRVPDSGRHPLLAREEIACLAGAGIQGDRFFNYKPNYRGQITFFAAEVHEDLCRRLGVSDRGPEVFRRNVITRGVDLNELIGKEFDLQGVRFFGVSECSPCAWMDHAFAEGAEDLLRGRGGLRARILSSGTLRLTGAMHAER